MIESYRKLPHYNKTSIMNRKSNLSDFAGSVSPVSEDINLTGGIISEKETSGVETLTDLWILAKITHDTIGDPILDSIKVLATDLKPLDKTTYAFDYHGYQCIYFSCKDSASPTRIAIPRLAPIEETNLTKLAETVNLANTMVGECKFVIIGGDVWIIHERCCKKEEYIMSFETILKQLKVGVELFRRMI